MPINACKICRVFIEPSAILRTPWMLPRGGRESGFATDEQHQRLSLTNGIVGRGAIDHGTGNRWHLREVVTILFFFDFDPRARSVDQGREPSTQASLNAGSGGSQS